MQRAYWSPSTFLPNMIKKCLRVSKLWSAQGWGYNISDSGEITTSTYRIQWELSLMHGTCLLVLFIPTKYYQITSNSMGVTACRLFQLQGRQLHNQDSESCFSCMQPAYWSSFIFLPNIIKICPRVPKLWSKQGCVYGRTLRWSLYPTNLLVGG